MFQYFGTDGDGRFACDIWIERRWFQKIPHHEFNRKMRCFGCFSRPPNALGAVLDTDDSGVDEGALQHQRQFSLTTAYVQNGVASSAMSETT